jgi:flagellar biosynthesis anti-sigma factor FlgM
MNSTEGERSYMNLNIRNQGRSVDPSFNLKSSTAPSGSATSQSATSTQKAGQDTVSISNTSSQLSGAFAVRKDKIAVLRSQITDGTYTVDASAVATAMLRDHFLS